MPPGVRQFLWLLRGSGLFPVECCEGLPEPCPFVCRVEHLKLPIHVTFYRRQPEGLRGGLGNALFFHDAFGPLAGLSERHACSVCSPLEQGGSYIVAPCSVQPESFYCVAKLIRDRPRITYVPKQLSKCGDLTHDVTSG